jgi:hypothetical protein
MLDECATVSTVTMTLVYTNESRRSTMKQSYTAPSVKILGSLADLTLREKETGTPNDGDYLKVGHVSLTTVS